MGCCHQQTLRDSRQGNCKVSRKLGATQTSCLVGLTKSVSKARTEYNEVVTAAATQLLEQDMRTHARSNGLTMPNLEEV